MSTDIPPEMVKVAPGFFGSLVSMLLFVKETTVTRRLAMFAAGVGLSKFGAAWAAHMSGLDEGFSGFMMGMCGMSIVAKFFEAWEDLQLSLILRDWIRKIAGLPPVPPKEI